MIDYSAMAFPKESWKKPKEQKNHAGSSLKNQQRKKTEKPKKAKQAAGRKRKKHRKSIMHPKGSGYCYLCALLHNDYTYKQTQEHHAVFGSGQRALSEEYGLMVQLCGEHHKDGLYAAHTNKEIRELLCRDAQAAFMTEYPELDWLKIFKKNYLEAEDETTKETEQEAERNPV